MIPFLSYQIKYDGPMYFEHVSEELEKATKEKFLLWDRIVKYGWIESGNESEKAVAYQMLKDPTIYAYAFFKDPKDSRKPLKLYCYQDVVINDPNKRVLFVAANQIGKTLSCGSVKGCTYALQNPGTTTLITSKTLPQSKDVLRQIKQLLSTGVLDYKYDIGDFENRTEIYFKHFEEYEDWDVDLGKSFTKIRELPQSRIICVPATEAALGYPADLVILDEIHFYKDGDYFFKQIIQPRTYTTKGQILAFTNPNGQQGVVWEWANDPAWSKYYFDFLDCPTNTRKEFDRLCVSMTREQIDSTLLAKFTDPEGGFFTLQERSRMFDRDRPNALTSTMQRVFIFFDWAKSRDRTVRIIGIPVKGGEHEWSDRVHVLEMKEYASGTPYTKIIDEDLKNLVLQLTPQNVALVGWDNTGVGKGLEDFAKRVEQLGVQTMPVEFSLENKSRIYTLFKLLVEQGRLSVPYEKECDKQLSMLRFKRTQRGMLQVHHENERDRDDYPDALAGLCSLIIQPESAPVTVTIV